MIGLLYQRNFLSKHIRIIGSLMCLFACSHTAAECSRGDVNYYLEKGFSHEQVTAICGGNSSSDNRQRGRYQAHEDPDLELERTLRAEKKIADDILLARTAIAGWDIELTPKKLEYTRKFCVTAGKTSEVEGRTRACPDVRYRIHFPNLKVKDFERKYFFIGQREIEVVGKVQRKLLSRFDEYPRDLQRELLQKYRSTIRKDGTFIPIRKDVAIARIVTLLKSYAARATRTVG